MGSLLTLFNIFSKLAIFPTKIDTKKSTIRFSALSLRTVLSACLVSMPYIVCTIWFFSTSSDCRKDFWEAFKKTYEKIDIAVMIVYPFSIMTPLCPILWNVMISKILVSVPEFSLSSKFNFPKNWLQILGILGLMITSFMLSFFGISLSVTGNMKPYPFMTLANVLIPLFIPPILTLVYTFPSFLTIASILQMMCRRLCQVPPSLLEREMWARNTILTFERLQKGSNFGIFLLMFFR